MKILLSGHTPTLLTDAKLLSENYSTSIVPLLLPNRQAIEHLAMELPLGNESVHQRDEAGVVGRLQQMDQLVNDDVFEAFNRFLHKFRIEPDRTCPEVTTTPPGFHSLHIETAYINPNY